MSNFVKCDKCGDTMPEPTACGNCGNVHMGPGQLAEGWSHVVFHVAGPAADHHGPGYFPGMYPGGLAAPPPPPMAMGAYIPGGGRSVMTSSLDLCTKCTAQFVLASGCAARITTKPSDDGPGAPPRRPVRPQS